ncbi:hypothetical protein FA13DRAFT_565652 [Coprinellus micaceus]|uniref:Uncharacterized protein n=1 Tax=Coprinellus micaceus TaxID=71717 RepID=A0A4Y7T7E2_COPMI|nr:hypothetical protein FA13DRAFT_565652 [Coprinellus micaceus]
MPQCSCSGVPGKPSGKWVGRSAAAPINLADRPRRVRPTFLTRPTRRREHRPQCPTRCPHHTIHRTHISAGRTTGARTTSTAAAWTRAGRSAAGRRRADTATRSKPIPVHKPGPPPNRHPTSASTPTITPFTEPPAQGRCRWDLGKHDESVYYRREPPGACSDTAPRGGEQEASR